jgi:hypothetical protein
MTDDRVATPAEWAALAAPIPAEKISWRQDGRAIARGDQTFARFVCYIDAGTVRERLDAIFPGRWELDITPLPQVTTADADGVDNTGVAFRATLTVAGVSRADVGQGKDWKAASTDAFKRSAVRFGIGHELYDMDVNWVPVDGDSKYPKPLIDPQENYERRHGKPAAPQASARERERVPAPGKVQDAVAAAAAPPTAAPPAEGPSEEVPACPDCGGRMWDNRMTKRNPRAPDYKCRDRNCGGVYWPGQWPPKPLDDDQVEAFEEGRTSA